MKFTKDTKTATISRLWTLSSWGFKKSWYNATWKSYVWHLKALSIKNVTELSNFWKEFTFHTEYDADILESDKLVIDWVDYDVKWLSKFDWITFSRLICILQKW